MPGHYPWTTFGINVAGAFVLALLLVLILEAWEAPTWLRPLAGTGFLGAFTTFSAVVFALDRFAAADQWLLFCAYLAFSVLAGLAAASFGVLMGSVLGGRPHQALQPGPGRGPCRCCQQRRTGRRSAGPAASSDQSSR